MSDSIKNIEIQTLKAVEAYFQNDKPNAAKLAREIGGPYSRLRGRIHGRKDNSIIARQSRALKPIQEKNWFSEYKPYITLILALHLSSLNVLQISFYKSAQSGRVVGSTWMYRFLSRLPPEVQYIDPKPTEKVRVDSENFGDCSFDLLTFNWL